MDVTLSAQMQLAREICSKGRAARMEQKLKVRQPLSKVEVILADETHLPWLQAHQPLIADELNVKQVEFTRDAARYIEYEVRPNFKLLGPRVGKLMPHVKAALAAANPAQLMDQLGTHGSVRDHAEGQRSRHLVARRDPGAHQGSARVGRRAGPGLCRRALHGTDS